MSEENVEIVRRSYDAYLRGDLESALAACDHEIETDDHDIPDSGEYRGFEGLARWQADWESSWESWRWDPEEFIEAVSASSRFSAFMPGDARVASMWNVSTLRCGRCETANACASTITAAGSRPSKPPDCRNSRFGRKATVLLTCQVSACWPAPPEHRGSLPACVGSDHRAPRSPAPACRKRCSGRPPKEGVGRLAKTGRRISRNTARRRSSGATMKRGISLCGCSATKSAIRRRPE